MEELVRDIVAGGAMAGSLAALGLGFVKWASPRAHEWLKASPGRQETFGRALAASVGLVGGYFYRNEAMSAAAIGLLAAFIGPAGRDILHRLILRK